MCRNLYFPHAKTAAFRRIGSIGSGQDGAIHNGTVFHFDADGICRVYALESMRFISSFILGSIDLVVPHSNAVSFGPASYAEGDEFPLLYTNVYNNYSMSENRREGTLCVYRLARHGAAFSGELMQQITVGFVNDDLLWKSKHIKDARPYGNFVVDRENSALYAFVMRDEAHRTRFFKFRLPRLDEGSEVRLAQEDILDQFDSEYVNFMQGAVCHSGYLYSLEGFDAASGIPPLVRVFDLNKKSMVFQADLASLGLTLEPEFIDVYENKLYYGDSDGNLYEVLFHA